jgi:hypothetical protein
VVSGLAERRESSSVFAWSDALRTAADCSQLPDPVEVTKADFQATYLGASADLLRRAASVACGAAGGLVHRQLQEA